MGGDVKLVEPLKKQMLYNNKIKFRELICMSLLGMFDLGMGFTEQDTWI